MGLYHGVEHYEKLKINESSDVELFKSSWSKLLTDNFETRYDWSYIVAWVSFFLISMDLINTFQKETNTGKSQFKKSHFFFLKSRSSHDLI